MTVYQTLKETLINQPATWLVTGAAGFIGSNLVERLLTLNQRVVGLDNFSTGFRKNLDQINARITPAQQKNFSFIEGDIRSLDDCMTAMTWRDPHHREAPSKVEYVLHQAALGSVPRSINDPIATNASNITGFLNMLVASRDAAVKRFIYAGSSSTYGDHPDLPRIEHRIGKPLSPYAVTKYVNELYADVFSKTYGLNVIGLRYFNVFGRRQNPEGAYAAVIPKWIASLIKGQPVTINGDGETSRDFCYIDNVIQANLLAATTENQGAINQVYNIAVGDKTTLNVLYQLICQSLQNHQINIKIPPVYSEFRQGDVKHSLADITQAKTKLGYCPSHSIENGLVETMDWYLENLS